MDLALLTRGGKGTAAPDHNYWMFTAEYQNGGRSPRPPRDDGSIEGDGSTATSSG